MTEGKMVGWYHRLNEHEFEQTLGDGEGQGSLACYSPWGRKELDMTVQSQQENHFNPVQHFVTLLTVTCQAPLSMGFSSKSTGMSFQALL